MFHVKHSTTRRRPTTRRSQPLPPINHHPAQCGTRPPAPAPPPAPTTAVRCPPVDRRPRRGVRPRRRPHPPGSRPPTTARRQPSTTCRPHRPTHSQKKPRRSSFGAFLATRSAVSRRFRRSALLLQVVQVVLAEDAGLRLGFQQRHLILVDVRARLGLALLAGA